MAYYPYSELIPVQGCKLETGQAMAMQSMLKTKYTLPESTICDDISNTIYNPTVFKTKDKRVYISEKRIIARRRLDMVVFSICKTLVDILQKRVSRGRSTQITFLKKQMQSRYLVWSEIIYLQQILRDCWTFVTEVLPNNCVPRKEFGDAQAPACRCCISTALKRSTFSRISFTELPKKKKRSTA